MKEVAQSLLNEYASQHKIIILNSLMLSQKRILTGKQGPSLPLNPDSIARFPT